MHLASYAIPHQQAIPGSQGREPLKFFHAFTYYLHDDNVALMQIRYVECRS